jgi:hypothetical protein
MKCLTSGVMAPKYLELGNLVNTHCCCKVVLSVRLRANAPEGQKRFPIVSQTSDRTKLGAAGYATVNHWCDSCELHPIYVEENILCQQKKKSARHPNNSTQH